MSYSYGFCPRCGSVAGTWHTKPMCDAAYDRAYRAAGYPQPITHTVVTGEDPNKDITVLGRKPKEIRKFHVARKGMGFFDHEGTDIQIHETGALVIRDEGALVITYAPHAWSFVEESDVDD